METPVFLGERAPGVEDFAALRPLPANAVTLWCAAQVLKAAGFSVESAAAALKEIYGAEVPKEVVAEWFESVPEFVKKACARNSGLSRFVQLVLTGRLSERLWALRYVAGAAMGDGDEDGRLRVKDWCFAHTYALALAVLHDNLSAAKVCKLKDGRFGSRKSAIVSFVIKSGLWRILAFIDRFDEIKYFLAGLLDAEGSISPKLDHNLGELKVQLHFGNTNVELVKFVENALKELGFKPFIRTKRHNKPHSINGKLTIRKKLLYEVYTIAEITHILPLTKVGFRCWRKQQLFSFFLLIAQLPPLLRYQIFLHCWKKVNGRWVLKKPLPPDYQKIHPPTFKENTSKTQRARVLLREQWKTLAQNAPAASCYNQRKYIVLCPACKQPGIFELHADSRLQIRVHHEGRICVCNITTRGSDPNPRHVTCKCGKPGHIFVSIEDVKDGERLYTYVRVRVAHKNKNCSIKALRLLQIIN